MTGRNSKGRFTGGKVAAYWGRKGRQVCVSSARKRLERRARRRRR